MTYAFIPSWRLFTSPVILSSHFQISNVSAYGETLYVKIQFVTSNGGNFPNPQDFIQVVNTTPEWVTDKVWTVQFAIARRARRWTRCGPSSPTQRLSRRVANDATALGRGGQHRAFCGTGLAHWARDVAQCSNGALAWKYGQRAAASIRCSGRCAGNSGRGARPAGG